MAYEVTHRTEYHYPSTVSSSFGEIVMLPRELAGQACLRSELTIEPAPHDLRERLDFFGNRTAYFAVLAPHTRLSVTATSLVRVHDRQVRPSAEAELPWERAREAWGRPLSDEALDACQFVLDSPLVTSSEQLAEYATPSFPPGRPLLASVVDLSSRIHRDFEFLPGVTEVKTTIEEVFARRAGVCQDFAHVTIGCLRSLGLAARYVSGYLETRPPPGKARLAGADVSHAWVSVYVPGAGWADVDPTNDQLVNDRYVTTAWGRDYTDVPPLKGVIFTQGDVQDLRVSVDVVPVDDPE
ncbi:MAG TPA: transglutaminase family protein [Pseudonocardia sp.]|jgi:transglutaminase-like putative cysteine protease|nr:transglutaminase family protein [Pseudonocardia sp.]